MNNWTKEEPIIELTDVVEESPSEGQWMETTPPPLPEKKLPEPPKPLRRESPSNPEDLKAIPESPLKKFLMAEEPFLPLPAEGKAPEPSSPAGMISPSAYIPEPPPMSSPVKKAEPSAPRPEPAVTVAEAPGPSPESPRPPVPNLEAEMKAIREAMLSRVEKWIAQEGSKVLEKVAREIFPKIAEEAIRKEIEKLKSDAEEKE